MDPGSGLTGGHVTRLRRGPSLPAVCAMGAGMLHLILSLLGHSGSR